MMSTLPNKDHYRVSEAAKFLKVSTKTLRRWDKAGKLVPLRSLGDQRFYSKESLEAFLLKKINQKKNHPKLVKASNVRLFARTLKLGFSFAVFTAAILTPFLFVKNEKESNKLAQEAGKENINQKVEPKVLAATITNYTLNINSPAVFNGLTTFNKEVTFAKNITAPNVIYGLTAGAGVSLTPGQNPTITNTGVLSLGGSTGDLSLASGTGISVSGLTITNSDLGSSQYIFKNIAVSGQTTITAGANSGTLTLEGTGITITTDTTSKTVTFFRDTPDYTASGWTKNGAYVYTTTLTDKVGIGNTNPNYNLEVTGTGYFSGNLNLAGSLTASGSIILGDATTDGLTFTGRVANATNIVPLTDLGATLGKEDKRFDYVYLGNINSNSSLSASGQATFTYEPVNTSYSEASVLLNPATAVENGSLVSFAVGDLEKARIDAEGNLTLGYLGTGSVPNTSKPIAIYNHGTTNIAYIDTSGNFYGAGGLDINGSESDIAGTLNLSGNSLTSSGALTITPNSGNNLNINLSGTGNFAINTNQLYVDTSTSFVGIGTTSPTANLDIATISGKDGIRLTSGGTKKFGIGWNTNLANLDLPTDDNVNLLTNGNFDTDITTGGWIGTQTYILNDEFTTNRTAGSLNGTNADGVGTRTVTDSAGTKMSIESGKLIVNNSTGYNDPGLWLNSTSRSAGKAFISEINITTSNGAFIGWDSNQTTWLSDYLMFNVGSINFDSSSASNLIGSYSTSTSYKVAIVMRSTGMYYFIKGGVYTDWSLLWHKDSGSTTPLYPAVTSYGTSSHSTDFIRVPITTWLPTPLAYDTFSRGDGSLGSTETTGPDSQTTPSLSWAGSTWTISNNKAINTPTVSDTELIINGDMSSSTSWTVGSGWSIAGGVATGTTPNSSILQAVLTKGKWYRATYDVVTRDAGSVVSLFGGYNVTRSAVGSYIDTGKASATPAGIYGNVLFNGSVDNVSFKELSLSSLFATVPTSDTDIVSSADLTVTSGTQAGLVTNLNSTSSPTAGVLAYYDNGSGKIVLDKFTTATTWTNLINTSITYSAGATLRVITYHSDANTLKVRVYYNNAMVGTEQTVTDTEIINNTRHGLFSTHPGNTFDNFTLFARGSDGEYAQLGPGWYKLQGTFTGIASAQPVGVRVKAGKTVYLDNVSLSLTSSTSNSTLYIANSGTGVAGLDVQSTSTLRSGLASSQALVVKGTSSQSADLTQWQNVEGTTLASINASGYLATAQVSAIDGNGLKLYDDGGNGIFVKDGGNVGIGNTNPAYKLDVLASGTGVIARFVSENTSGCEIADGGTIACSSDLTLKKNISNLSQGIETVMKLRPVAFNWNFENEGTPPSFGFIAQEVENVIPKLVTTDPTTNLKNLNTIGLVPLLTQAVQELNSEKRNESGMATILPGTHETLVKFKTPFTNIPTVSISPVGKTLAVNGYTLANIDREGFTIIISDIFSDDLIFNWVAFER